MSNTVYRNYKAGTIKIKLKQELFFNKVEKEDPEISIKEFAECMKIYSNFLKIVSGLAFLKYTN